MKFAKAASLLQANWQPSGATAYMVELYLHLLTAGGTRLCSPARTCIATNAGLCRLRSAADTVAAGAPCCGMQTSQVLLQMLWQPVHASKSALTSRKANIRCCRVADAAAACLELGARAKAGLAVPLRDGAPSQGSKLVRHQLDTAFVTGLLRAHCGRNASSQLVSACTLCATGMHSTSHSDLERPVPS